MKIGLVRHFKVLMDSDLGLLTSGKYRELMTDYDLADVEPCQVDLRGISWNRCYSSDLSRARITAQNIFGGSIREDELLREVDLRLTREIPGEYTYFEWTFHSILGWSQNKDYVLEKIEETRERARIFLDGLEEQVDRDDRVLLVCHGLLMRVLEEELRARGFEGDHVVSPANGHLYLLEKIVI